MFWFFDETLMFLLGNWVILFKDVEDSCSDVSITVHTNWYYFRSNFSHLSCLEQLCLGSESSPAEFTVTNLRLDCGSVTPESDKEAAPSVLSQRLSGLKMMVWLCSPVPTCPTLQSALPRRRWEVFYGCWEFLVLRRWAVWLLHWG